MIMYVISESSHKIFDKIENEEINFTLSFLSAENIGFLDKEMVISKSEYLLSQTKTHGYMIKSLGIDMALTYFIDYDNFSAGKAAKIAYLISKSEIEEVTDIIYSAYMEIIDKEINKSVSEIKMTDIFNLDL